MSPSVRMAAVSLVIAFALPGTLPAAVRGQEDVKLPPPRMDGGMPLMQALKERHSTREFAAKKLTPEVLSNLLWAADGINRQDSGKRTAPSARNWQEIDIYVLLEEGAFLYDAQGNLLKAVADRDLRKLAGVQDFVAGAPLNLVYVADTARMKGASAEDEALYEGADTAFIAQNVYLFCASEGLAVVVRASLDRKAMAEALRLPPEKKITLAQTVGYPAAPGGSAPAPGSSR